MKIELTESQEFELWRKATCESLGDWGHELQYKSGTFKVVSYLLDSPKCPLEGHLETKPKRLDELLVTACYDLGDTEKVMLKKAVGSLLRTIKALDLE
jgi:hypothetical protein